MQKEKARLRMEAGSNLGKPQRLSNEAAYYNRLPLPQAGQPNTHERQLEYLSKQHSGAGLLCPGLRAGEDQVKSYQVYKLLRPARYHPWSPP